MQLAAYVSSDIGKVKDENEDSFYADTRDGLFILADGMGGHAAGEVASRMVVELIPTALQPLMPQLQALAAADTPDGRKRIFAELEEAVRKADRAVYTRGEAEPDKRGMATTLDVVFMAHGSAFIVHVGDSRVYLLRDNQANLLTTDHNLANHMRALGKMKPEEISAMPQRNALVRAIGTAGGVTPDLVHVDLLAGDRFILCSDGFSNYVRTNEEFVELVYQAADERSASSLVKFANERGGHDNITAVLVVIEKPGAARRTLETTQKIRVLQKVALFRGLTSQEILKVLNPTEEVMVGEGETIIKEGSSGAEMYMLLEGSVVVEADGVTIAELAPGAQFGELAMVDDRPRSATVRTVAPSRFLVLRRDDFRELTRTGELAPKLLWNLIHDITDRLRTTNWQLTEQVRAVHFPDARG